jgi:membrane protein involved in colicin uptake
MVHKIETERFNEMKTMKELIDAYNTMAANLGKPAVTRLSSLADGRKRNLALFRIAVATDESIVRQKNTMAKGAQVKNVQAADENAPETDEQAEARAKAEEKAQGVTDGVDENGRKWKVIGGHKVLVEDTAVADKIKEDKAAAKKAKAETAKDDREKLKAERAAKKAEAKAAEGEKTPGKRGKISPHAGKHLYPLKSENTRKPGTFGFNSMKVIFDNPGIVYEDYIKAGGRSNDLTWDIEHGNAEVRDE